MSNRQNRSGGGGLFSRLRAPKREEKPRADTAPDPEIPMTEEEQLRDLIERYGAYLDEYNEPWQGINPRPKYYVVPKETPPPLQEARPAGPPETPVEMPVETPAAEPVRAPVKVSPRPVRKQPARVTIRLRAKKTAKTVTVTVKAKKKPPVKVTPKKISKE